MSVTEMIAICDQLIGLVHSDPRLPLEKRRVGLSRVKVDATIHDLVAQVTIEQVYTNDSDKTIEVKYLFPLEEGAAVSSFKATIGQTTVTAAVKEKQEAKDTYDRAIAEHKTAVLAEKTKDDVFTMQLGNLAARQTCIVQLTYVTELALEGTTTRFTLPTVVAPRYAPKGTDPISFKAPRAFGSDLDYRLAFQAQFAASSKIVSAHSPSHDVVMTRTNAYAGVVGLKFEDAVLDRDIVLLLAQEHPFATRSAFEVDAQHNSVAMQLTFVPPPQDEKLTLDLSNEFIILVDRSGSMDGSRITQVQKLLPSLLRSLPTNSRFNIIGFGSTVDKLFPVSAPYTDANVAIAMNHIKNNVKADLGGMSILFSFFSFLFPQVVLCCLDVLGTELLKPLDEALSQPMIPGMPRQLFLLTDGQVENSEQCINKVGEYAHTCRVFTFGMGNSVSTALVTSLARAGHGKAEFISDNESVGDKVMRQLQCALQPALTNVMVDWRGLLKEDASIASDGGIQLCPQKLPPMFAQNRYFAYGIRLPPLSQIKDQGEILIKTVPNLDRKETIIRVPFDKTAPQPSGIIHALAARARIRELELQEAVGIKNVELQNRIKQEMVALGTTYNLASKHTSFVAVFQETSVFGESKKIEVPLALPTEVTRDRECLSAAFSFGGPSFGAKAACALSLPSQATGFSFSRAAKSKGLASQTIGMSMDSDGDGDTLEVASQNVLSRTPSDKEPLTQCYFATTGTNFAKMDVYLCYDCGLDGTKLCCRACVAICHKGHHVKFSKRLAQAFCDCGENKTCATKCKCLKPNWDLSEPVLLNQLIEGQGVDGAWADDTALLTVVKEMARHDSAPFWSQLYPLLSDYQRARNGGPRKKLATQFALALLKMAFGKTNGNWKWIGQKAERYLSCN